MKVDLNPKQINEGDYSLAKKSGFNGDGTFCDLFKQVQDGTIKNTDRIVKVGKHKFRVVTDEQKEAVSRQDQDVKNDA